MTETKLVDCGEKDIKCSSCNKILLHFRIYLPQDECVQKIKATCPFCGDASFITSIYGRAHIGPVGKDEHLPPTIIEDIDSLDNGVFLYKIRKGQK